MRIRVVFSIFLLLTACQKGGQNTGPSDTPPAAPPVVVPPAPVPENRDCKPKCKDALRNLSGPQIAYLFGRLIEEGTQNTKEPVEVIRHSFLLAKIIEESFRLSPDEYTTETFLKLSNELFDESGRFRTGVDVEEIARNL